MTSSNKTDFYRRGDVLKNCIETLKRENKLSVKRNNVLNEQNKSHFLKFYDEQMSLGHSPSHIHKMLLLLNRAVEYADHRDLATLEKDDIKAMVAKFEASELSEWSIQNAKATIKVFYRWLAGIDEKRVYPEKVRWITATRKKRGIVLPDTILSENEVHKLIEAASSLRNKALISFLYYSAARVGEAMAMRIKDVVFLEDGMEVKLRGKTGMRQILVIGCTSYMSMWLNNHPFKDKSDSPMWIRMGTQLKNQVMEYNTIRKLLREAAKKAKIEKDVNPHAFRHSGATRLAKHLTEQEFKIYCGWTMASPMAAVYVHLSGRDVHDSIRKMHGIEVKKLAEDVERQLKEPIKCPTCGLFNEAGKELCDSCRRPLTINVALKQTKDMDAIRPLLEAIGRDPKIAEALIEMAAQQRANEIIEEKKKKQG